MAEHAALARRARRRQGAAVPRRRPGAARARRARHHRRGAGRPPLQGRLAAGRRRGAHGRRPPPARLCRDRFGRARAERTGASWSPIRRSTLTGIPEADAEGSRFEEIAYDAAHRGVRVDAACRAGAIPKPSPRRCGAPCARRSPRIGTRSRYATCTCSRCRPRAIGTAQRPHPERREPLLGEPRTSLPPRRRGATAKGGNRDKNNTLARNGTLRMCVQRARPRLSHSAHHAGGAVPGRRSVRHGGAADRHPDVEGTRPASDRRERDRRRRHHRLRPGGEGGARRLHARSSRAPAPTPRSSISTPARPTARPTSRTSA